MEGVLSKEFLSKGVLSKGFCPGFAMAAFTMLQNNRCEHPKIRIRQQTKDLQDKLCNLCKDCRDGRKTIHQMLTQGFIQDHIVTSYTITQFTNFNVFLDLKWTTHTRDTIYTHFYRITDNIYNFGRPFAPSFFTQPSNYMSTCPNDGWTGLCKKSCVLIANGHSNWRK